MKLCLKITRPGQQNQSGFTLIELLIYVAIFAMIIGGVVGLALTATAQKARSQAVAEVNYQAQAVLDLMSQTVSQATTVTAPAAGQTANRLALKMPVASVDPTTFLATTDTTTTRLQMQEGSPAIANNLTNGRVRLSNLQFKNLGLDSSGGSVLISFTLTYRTNSDRQELTFSKNFYGAASIR